MAKNYTIVLDKDQDVMEGIHAFLMDKKWKSAIILSGMGSIYDVTVANPGSYDMPPKMNECHVDKPCEIVSFMGEITRKEDAPEGLPCQILDTPSDYIVHVHMAFSHDDGVVNGGGFRKATVLRAINIYVIAFELEE